MTEAQKPETPVKPDDGIGGVSADDRSRKHRLVHAWHVNYGGYPYMHVLGSNGRLWARVPKDQQGRYDGWTEIATYPPGLEP